MKFDCENSSITMFCAYNTYYTSYTLRVCNNVITKAITKSNRLKVLDFMFSLMASHFRW